MKTATYTSICYCTWSYRVAPGYPWEILKGDVAICRASVGNRIVTVWLPRGTKIRLRRPRVLERDRGNYRHTFGRYRDNLIEIHVPDAVMKKEI